MTHVMLYLVATPIGNLGDISMRAAKTLSDVDFIAAEDTRVTRKLLEYLKIKKPLLSYYEHNSRESGAKILDRILSGQNCALVSDAGMPGISDPGENLVKICVNSGVQVLAIPGPCSAVTALALSGLPAGRFTFEGFLSTARKNRYERLEELKAESRTMVFFEAPHKLLRTLSDMLASFGDRRISISRELTKVYEETIRCNLSEALAYFTTNPPRGEFVIVIEGTHEEKATAKPDIDEAVRSAQAYIECGLSVKDAVKTAAVETGVSKNILYNAVVELKTDS